jgi:hypothetical protein
MIDFTKYKELKEKEAIVLQKVGTRAVLFVRSFDPQNGSENAPQTATVNPADVRKARAEAQAVVAGIDAFLADIAAAGVDTGETK